MSALVDYEVAWALPDAFGPSGIAIFLRTDGGPWKRLEEHQGTDGTPTIKGLEVGRSYEVGVAAIDGEGNVAPEKDWAIEPFIPSGNENVPTAPSEFGVGQDGEFLEARWKDTRASDPDFSHYELRYKSASGSGWPDARLIAHVLEPRHRWKWEVSGSVTFYVAAYDRFGRRSTLANVTVAIQALPDFVNGTSTDEDGGGFAGTKTDMEVDSGNLRYERWGVPANSATTPAHAEDATWLAWGPYECSYESAEIDLGSSRNVRIEPDLDWTMDGDIMARNADELVGVVPRVRDVLNDGTPVDKTDPSTFLDLVGCVANADEKPVEIDLWIKHDTSTPISNSYEPFVPGFVYCRYYRLKVVVKTWDRWRRVTINKLRHIERKRNLKEEGQVAVAGSPGPTTITFSVPFIDTPRLTAITDTAGYIVNIASISSSSATVRVTSDAGAEVFTGNIDWIAAGT
jgi:hypothetical protein